MQGRIRASDAVGSRFSRIAARDRVAKAEGMSEQQVVDANLLADLDARWKSANTGIESRFLTNIYRTLK